MSAGILIEAARDAEALPFLERAADGTRRRGITLQRCGRPAEAVRAFREAIGLLEGLANPTAGNIYDLACSQSLLSGVSSDPGSGLTATDGQTEADEAMRSLRRAVAAGWKDRAHTSADTDLVPLHSRPDFQELMLDLAFPTRPIAQ